MTGAMEVTEDYANVGLSLRNHPLAFLRPKLDQKRVVRAGDLKGYKSKYVIDVAGIVLVRQRPMTSSGVIFMTIEDETGNANLIIWPKMFERQRPEVMGAKMLVCRGVVQNESGVTCLANIKEQSKLDVFGRQYAERMHQAKKVIHMYKS